MAPSPAEARRPDPKSVPVWTFRDRRDFLRCRNEIDVILRHPPVRELEFVMVEEAATAAMLLAWDDIARQLNTLRGGKLNFTPMRSKVDVCGTVATNFMADHGGRRDDVWRFFLERIVTDSTASGSEVGDAFELETLRCTGIGTPCSARSTEFLRACPIYLESMGTPFRAEV